MPMSLLDVLAVLVDASSQVRDQRVSLVLARAHRDLMDEFRALSAVDDPAESRASFVALMNADLESL